MAKEREAAVPETTSHALAHARTLVTGPDGEADTIEIRSPDGHVELRVRLTPEGPVLSVEATRIAIQATDAIDMRCRHFRLDTDESLVLASQGAVGLAARGEMRLQSEEYLNLKGKLLGCNSDREAVLKTVAESHFGGDIDACRAWLAAPGTALPEPAEGE